MKTLLAVMALVAGFTAHAAEESTTKAKKEEVMKEQRENAPVAVDIDNEITNAKMRADAGSKSKHSISLGAGYNGGSLKDAFGKTRPDISDNSTNEQKTSAAGDLNYRYRLSASDSLTAGFGLKWLTPSYDGQKIEASNPAVGYNKSFKAGKTQNSLSVGSQKYTASELIKKLKINADIGFGTNTIVEIGTSGLQVGLGTSLGYTNYTEFIAGSQLEYSVAVSPYVEYAFNDKYNFRTVYRGNGYNSLRESNMKFEQEEPTQSLGIGIAATRDIFLYPNVQWVWRDVTSEKTNVALSASMNFF